MKKLGGRDGFVDLLWKGTLLVEQKSRGKDLKRAHQQAIDYFPGISDDDLPRWVLAFLFSLYQHLTELADASAP